MAQLLHAAVIGLLVLAGWSGDADRRFVPATHPAGDGRVALPVRFTDGTRATLVYPRKLRLAELGVVPYGSGTLDSKIGRDFWIMQGDPADFPRGTPTLLGTYVGADGQPVGFWDTGPTGDDFNYLGFQFGSWAVLVYDYAPEFDGGAASMTDEERAERARSFSGRETARGFLRLTGHDALRLARAGEHAGPQLMFGGRSPFVVLFPGRCRPGKHQDRLVHGKRVQLSRGFADWCASDSMRVHATGRRQFLRALIRGLSVR